MASSLVHYDKEPADRYVGTLVIHAAVPRDLDPRHKSRLGLTLETAKAAIRRDSGHAWIEFISTDGTRRTWGTWESEWHMPGLRIHHHRGLAVDRELDLERVTQHFEGPRSRQPASRLHVVRGKDLSPHELERFKKLEKQYAALGPSAFSALFPCSQFAAEVWEKVTRERLHHRSMGLSSPALLAERLIRMNRRDQAREQDYEKER